MLDSFLVRPVRAQDLPEILALAQTTNPGLTNLLPDEKLIEKNIHWSLQSFAKNINRPERELYFFVLEDLTAEKVIGTCGIFSDVGEDFYSFRVSREWVSSETVNMRRENHTLLLVNDYKNVSELALLLIHKKFRKKGLGKFLSRSRYLYFADYPERFHSHLIAEMRGIIDIWGNSIFWDALGSRFVDLEFKEVDYLTATNQKHFIPELYPHTPIPVELLSKAAQKAVGASHPDTKAAISVLLKEGFEVSRYVDIFDGGPTLEVVAQHVKTIAQSKRARVAGIDAKETGSCALVSFQAQEYRIAHGELICLDNGEVELTAALASRLGCEPGDTVRFIID